MSTTAVTTEIVFTLTDSNLDEGGRPRDPLEVCMNADSDKAAYLGDDEFRCLTDDGQTFLARLSGTQFKNFRSRPVIELGVWLKGRCRAQAGDEVRAWWADDPGYGRVCRLVYVRRHRTPEPITVEQRRLERETEDAVVAALDAAGVPYQRQVRVASGVIDVLTPDAIREVKTFLTREAIYQAVGQLFCYRAEAENGAALRLIVCGRQTRETAPLIPVLAKVGVEVDTWQA